MKNKKYLIFIFFLSLIFIIPVKADSIIKYNKTYEYNNIENYKNILTIEDKKYILTETSSNATKIIRTTSSFEESLTKEFSTLSNSEFIKYNNNIIIVGIEKNSLKVYLIDKNLQITNQKETSYMIDNDATIKTYQYDNKVYLMLFENENMLSSTIYEIDNNLNITENNLSSYESSLVKKILKGDYYLIRMNDQEENNRITHYLDTSYTKDYSILVGYSENTIYNETTGYDYRARFTIIDKEGNIVLNTEDTNNETYLDVEFIKDKIIILSSNQKGEHLLIYNTSGKLEESIELSRTYNNKTLSYNQLTKTNNQLIIYAQELAKEIDTTNIFVVYNFNISIIVNDNLYGQVNVEKDSLPGKELTIEVIPNSGYELDNIEIIDNIGNIIPVINNKFIMPEDDIYITVNYKVSVENPETTDIIIIVSITTIIGISSLLILLKKLKWLK
ncbi:MAG: hypothetical protein ACI4XM_07025 [Candidatus Coprovivens sp.]